MPKKAVRRIGRKRTMKGKGLWDKIKKGAKKVNDFLKESRVISKVSGALSGIVPYADVVHNYSDKYGYGNGKRKRVVRKRGGARLNVRRGGARTKLERGMIP